MPDIEKRYGTKITTVGAARITACVLAGTKLKITQAAAGDGGGGYYVPTVEQTELVGELWRGPIVSAVQNPAVPNMLDVKIVIDDSVGNFVCREMGLFSEDGELIAVCNTPDTEKVAISTGVDGRLTMVMHIVVADASVLEFTIIPALDVVSREDLERAISEHNTDPAAHEDIRQAITDAVEAHDNAADVHPELQNTVGGIDARLAVLELKYGTNITGNSFTVTFAALTGLVVTGVWNETYQRVEFLAVPNYDIIPLALDLLEYTIQRVKAKEAEYRQVKGYVMENCQLVERVLYEKVKDDGKPHFPKSQTFHLCAKLEDCAADILEKCISADGRFFETEYEERLQDLDVVVVKCDTMLHYINLSFKKGYISGDQCHYWAEMVRPVRQKAFNWRRNDGTRAAALREAKAAQELAQMAQMAQQIAEAMQRSP